MASMMLSACNKKNNDTEQNVNSYIDSTSSVKPSFKFVTALNALRINNTGLYESINDTQIECDSQDLELRISTYIQPDNSLNWNTVNQNIYIINNGRLISFYDIANGKTVNKMSITGNVNENTNVDIRIPLSELSGNNAAVINILVDFAPEYVAERNEEIPGLYEFIGLSSTSILIKSNQINDLGDTDCTYFPESSYIADQVIDSCFDIGYQYDGNQILTNHLSQDIIVNEQNKLYVKAALGEECSSDYVLCIFCNGEFLPILDGLCFVNFNTQNGKEVLNYCLDGEYMPKLSGEYSFYAVALPSYEAVVNGKTDYYSTSKNRIKIE